MRSSKMHAIFAAGLVIGSMAIAEAQTDAIRNKTIIYSSNTPVVEGGQQISLGYVYVMPTGTILQTHIGEGEKPSKLGGNEYELGKTKRTTVSTEGVVTRSVNKATFSNGTLILNKSSVSEAKLINLRQRSNIEWRIEIRGDGCRMTDSRGTKYVSCRVVDGNQIPRS